jgi:signal transduction histidine kinase
MEDALAGELRQRKRLAELGLSVSKINHELRNLLTTAQLLGDRLEGAADPTVRRVAPRLIGTIGRAVRFCEATLAYGRAAEPDPRRRTLAVRALTADLADLAALGDGQVAIRDLVPADLKVHVDPDQVGRALVNLVRNAVQALATARTRGARVTIGAAREGRQVVILVADNGPGLPPRARAHLFEPFQASSSPGGTGLGLPIAAELVRLNGGTLTLDEMPEGTRFRMTLPAA